MDKIRKIGAKIKGHRREDGGKVKRDKILRHSRSVPLRTSSETENSVSDPSDDVVLDIRAPDFPKIFQKDKRKFAHCHPGCDCWHCTLLDEFPAPPSRNLADPPMRPRERPRDMSQDFDDVSMLPDDVYEARKKERQLEKAELAYLDKVRHVVMKYNEQLARNELTRRFRDPIDLTEEEVQILCEWRHPDFIAGTFTPSTKGLGDNLHYARALPFKQPHLTRKTSRSTIASCRGRVVNDTESVRSFNDTSSVRSLRPQGRRNLNGYPAATTLVSEAASARSFRPSKTSPPSAFKDSSSASVRSHRSHRTRSPSTQPLESTETRGQGHGQPQRHQEPMKLQHSSRGGVQVTSESQRRRLASSYAKQLPPIPRDPHSDSYPNRV